MIRVIPTLLSFLAGPGVMPLIKNGQQRQMWFEGSADDSAFRGHQKSMA
jgi:hypothetical protein